MHLYRDLLSALGLFQPQPHWRRTMGAIKVKTLIDRLLKLPQDARVIAEHIQGEESYIQIYFPDEEQEANPQYPFGEVAVIKTPYDHYK